MSKKQFGTNIYWGNGIAPIECQYRLKCAHLSKPAFKQFVRDLKKEGIWYDTDKESQTVVMAFDSELQKQLHAVILEAKVKKAFRNYKIKGV